ncbi:MAG: nucleotide sugar dehydrogenase [Spirochaetes bacterium]|nr:nucleotide sugar dehydrogenase [Spirochaetota bacterium]
MTIYEEKLKKIKNNEEWVGILGLGYVGLPLAVTFALQGVNVLGFEKSQEKVRKIEKAENYIGDVTDQDLKEIVNSGKFSATTDFSRIADCDAILICVPTPLDRFKNPEMKYIEAACKEIGKYMKKGTFICLESTTYPTTTESYMLPIIEKESGMKHKDDFWLAFSPERVDPGNEKYKTENTPKVFGALSEEGKQIGVEIYQKAIKSLCTVSSPRVAEMVKILENTYRLVNISLINELALLCGKMEIDIWEVIEAAKTKPYGFQPFYPGPGIGGHCIPLDPFYLEHIAKKYDFNISMIHAAGYIDLLMPHRMTIKITSALNRQKKPINGSTIFFLGVAYKPNINDERESPALKIMDIVANKGGIVQYHDPFIPHVVTEEGNKYLSSSINDMEKADCVVITTNHSCFDEQEILKKSRLIVDLRNVIKTKNDKVYKL